MNARAIITALGGRWYGRSGMARCPAHDDRAPSLSIGEGREGQPLLFCFAGCEWPDIRIALRARGLWPGREPAGPRFNPAIAARRRAKRQCDDKQRIEAARRLWASGRPLTHDDAAGRYLTSRGLTLEPPPSLRYVADARHTPTGLLLPAMIAGVTRWPDRWVCAIQRTYLRADGRGKAAVSNARMSLAPITGGAIRLAAVDHQLGLCEGVEDGLAVLQATGIPMWAVLGKGGLRTVVLPPMPLAAEITIFPDRDHDGGSEDAARDLADRLVSAGRQVSIVLPPIGKDFNDTLRAGNPAECAA